MAHRLAALVCVLAATLVLRAQVPARDAPPRSGDGLIAGRVVSAATGDPLRNARVAVSSNAGASDRTFSDADGRFVLRHLPAGYYMLTATKPGYALTRFGARRSSDPPIAIEVVNGVPATIEVRMPKGAAITGRVLDDLGDPMLAVEVIAARLVRQNGRLTVAVAASGTSDDLGEYRVSGLSAGNYIVSAASGGRGVVGPATSWSRVYYPGVPSAADAQPIAVRPGDELSGVDLTVRPLRLGRVTINVVDQSGRTAEGPVEVALAPASPFGVLEGPRALVVTARAMPPFGLEPGDWLLVARADRDRGLAGSELDAQAGVGILALAMGSEDVSARVVLSKGARLTGTITFEGPVPPRPISIVADWTVASGATLFPGLAEFARVTGGTFAFGNLIGRREFRLANAPRGWMLKSLTYSGRSLLDEPIEFNGSESLAGAQAVVALSRSILTGAVVGADEMPLADYSVIVFPSDPVRMRLPSRWTRWARPNNAGTFAVDDLPPGDYLVAALDDVDDVVWSTPEYLDRLRGRATPVKLVDGAPQSVTLRLVDAP